MNITGKILMVLKLGNIKKKVILEHNLNFLDMIKKF